MKECDCLNCHIYIEEKERITKQWETACRPGHLKCAKERDKNLSDCENRVNCFPYPHADNPPEVNMDWFDSLGAANMCYAGRSGYSVGLFGERVKLGKCWERPSLSDFAAANSMEQWNNHVIRKEWEKQYMIK